MTLNFYTLNKILVQLTLFLIWFWWQKLLGGRPKP